MWRLFPMLLLAACAGAPGPAVVPGQGGDPAPCGADRMAAYIGQPVTALPGDEVPGPIRVIRPGDAVTEDLIGTRLNVVLDREDFITALTCG